MTRGSVERSGIFTFPEQLHVAHAVRSTGSTPFGKSACFSARVRPTHGRQPRIIDLLTRTMATACPERKRRGNLKSLVRVDSAGTLMDSLIYRYQTNKNRPTGFGYATQDAEVIDRRDYYPFGMEMPGRRWRVTGEGAGRFGYNGKENDNEVKGEGNAIDFGARMYDARIGRWMSVDPLASKHPDWTPYNYCANNLILLVDPDGRDWVISQSIRDDGTIVNEAGGRSL